MMLWHPRERPPIALVDVPSSASALPPPPHLRAHYASALPKTHGMRIPLAVAFPVGMPQHLSYAPSSKERSDAACRVVISTHCPSRASPLPPRDERIVGNMRMRHPRKLPPMRWWMYRAAQAPFLPFSPLASPKTHIIRIPLAVALPPEMQRHLSYAPSTKERSDAAYRVALQAPYCG